MSNIIEQKIGSFLIRVAPGSADDNQNDVRVFVCHGDELVFCDNFGINLHAAKEYINRNSKGNIRVVNGKFCSN